MIIKDILNEMGVQENVVDVIYISGKRNPFENMDLTRKNINDIDIDIDVDIDRGCEIEIKDCKTNDIVQMIDIYPYVERPDESIETSSEHIVLFLNKRFDEEKIYEKTHKLQMGKTKCMQCDKPFYNDELFWINDYQGITYKKVCSSECMNEALKDLDEAIKS